MSMAPWNKQSVGIALSVLAVAGCRPPRATPITGITPVAATLPRFELAPGARRIVFAWAMSDGNLAARGDGAARIAGPDSARVDLFLGGAFGGRGASAIVIGDSLRTPPGASMVDLVPPPPLLWAALGRLALPALPDTIIKVAGDTMRAAVGRPEEWRITAVGNRLVRVERVHDGRIVESVDRSKADHVEYHAANHRSLTLDIRQDAPAQPFDNAIWEY